MTTTEQATRTCRCGVTITWDYLPGRSAGRWMPAGSKRLDDSWCADGSLHKPGCPTSEVHDVITWTDSTGRLLVCPGDLVLVGSTLACVEAIAYDPPEDEAVRVDLEGWDMTHCASASALVAVRRWDNGEG